MSRDTVDEQRRLVVALSIPLTRFARLLCAGSADAEDLVQDTLVRVLVKWAKVQAADDAHAYAKRIMLNLFLGQLRAPRSREVPQAAPADQAAPGDEADSALDRAVVRDALLRMPRRQRAAVVLRYYDDLSERETAALMNCSVGNVKSLSARGLQTLREQLVESGRLNDVQ